MEPFRIDKDTRIVKKLVQRQRPRRGLTCNHISMPLSQTGSYTKITNRRQRPRRGLTRITYQNPILRTKEIKFGPEKRKSSTSNPVPFYDVRAFASIELRCPKAPYEP
ncbi:ATP-dependent RNA helicase MRH4, mitochondrial [Gossypium arboreum]|uniref:ATP-dependent RNA helicase MRH4, mitochondrial n=2 Tax=Gossypium arboreum TaxID=29729 RepID=A0A0B0MC66_GOSAR|nr:ATP-dependent RNA helicase MRH4, mitochondrial [Gossypium arboreum]